MNAERRRKLEVLEREIGNLDGTERRVLANLRAAGYSFRTTAQARQWLAAERTLQTRTADHLVEVIISARPPARRRTPNPEKESNPS
ncbi:hypothetical protein [Leifsonia sp. NPDC058248]|uniref:hypothetical protein n=1 Tax=Leifsonia sp. NPDC058248 TaxID=3346402 RepID=UPI0036DAED63